MLSPFSRNKRAQVGETMTWVVATLVIVVMISLSVFVVFSFGSLRDFRFQRTSDVLATKSLVNYLSGVGVYNKIKSDEKLNAVDEKMIEDLYKNDYAVSDLGIVPKDAVVSDVVGEYERSVDISIELNDKKDILLSLREWKNDKENQ